MGVECTCLADEQAKIEKNLPENQNSKFFYYSDPQLLSAFQDKLQSIQKNIEQTKRRRENITSAQRHLKPVQEPSNEIFNNWKEPSRISARKHSMGIAHTPTTNGQWTHRSNQQLKQMESKLHRENLAVLQNLDLERQSGWNEAIPKRLILEVGQVEGLWNTSESWFTQCRSMVQVEYAGTCSNSKALKNVTNPNFSELFIFPVSGDSDPGKESERHKALDTTKIFVSLLTIEGKSEIPADPQKLEEIGMRQDGTMTSHDNVYKRVAEFCLDISEICQDQLVHELTLTVPVVGKKPATSALFNPLRQCDISGLFNDQMSNGDLSQCSSFIENAATTQPTTTEETEEERQFFYPHLSPPAGSKFQSPPIKRDQVPQRELLSVFTEKQMNHAAQKNGDLSILDIISQIDDPHRIKSSNCKLQTNEHIRAVSAKMLAPTPRGTGQKLKKENSTPLQLFEPHQPGGAGDPEHFSSAGKSKLHARKHSLGGSPFQPDKGAGAAVPSLKAFELNLQQMLPLSSRSSTKAKCTLRRHQADEDTANTVSHRVGGPQPLFTQHGNQILTQGSSQQLQMAAMTTATSITSRHKDSHQQGHHLHQNFMTMTGTGCADSSQDQDFSQSVESVTANPPPQQVAPGAGYQSVRQAQNVTPLGHQKVKNAGDKHYCPTSRNNQKPKNTFYTPNDRKSKKRAFAEDQLEQQASKKFQSPVKAVPWEDALGKPCLSFSFDENFKLDSDMSQGVIDINENWSPIMNGGAPVSLENRVSPLKGRFSQQSKDDAGLLGGVFQIQHHGTTRNNVINAGATGGATLGSKGSRVHPISEFGLAANRLNDQMGSGLVNQDNQPAAEVGQTVKISLRIQYLRNAQEYLLSYKDRLHQANSMVRQMENI